MARPLTRTCAANTLESVFSPTMTVRPLSRTARRRLIRDAAGFPAVLVPPSVPPCVEEAGAGGVPEAAARADGAAGNGAAAGTESAASGSVTEGTEGDESVTTIVAGAEPGRFAGALVEALARPPLDSRCAAPAAALVERSPLPQPGGAPPAPVDSSQRAATRCRLCGVSAPSSASPTPSDGPGPRIRSGPTAMPR